MSRFQKAIKDFSENTSIDGIKYCVIFRNLYERFFWISVVLSSIGCSAYITTLFWTRYTSNPTRTIIKTAFAPPQTIPFPAVTICNINPIIQENIDKFVSKLDGSEQELLLTKKILTEGLLRDVLQYETPKLNNSELEIFEEVLQRNDYFEVRRILKRISQNCEELLVRCLWNKKPVKCSKLFKETYSDSGRCCSFNYIPQGSHEIPIRTAHSGIFSGLQVWIKPEYNSRLFAGAGVIVHNIYNLPYTLESRKVLSLETLNYFHVDASRRECSSTVKNLPISQRQCLYADEQKLEYFETYTDWRCLINCKAKAVLENCQCIPHYFDFVVGKPVCNLGKLQCISESMQVQKSSCDCPTQCEEDSYRVMLSSTKVMAADMEGSSINNTNDLLYVNIFFSNNKQTIWLRDTITTSIYLLSSFGGIYSLFLGCSVISFIEILYYIAKIWHQRQLGPDKTNKIVKVIQPINISTIKNKTKHLDYPNFGFIN